MTHLKVDLKSRDNMFMPGLGELIQAVSIHLMRKHSELRVLESVDFDKDMDAETTRKWTFFVELFEEKFTELLKDFCDSVSVNVYDDYNVEHMNSKNNLEIVVNFNEDKVNKNGIVLNALFAMARVVKECNDHKCDECHRLGLKCNKICEAMNDIDKLSAKTIWTMKNLSYRQPESIVEFLTICLMNVEV